MLIKPERIKHGEWAADDVTLDEVQHQLSRLRSEFAPRIAREDGTYELPHPRNCVMNLVAIAADEAGAERAAKVGEQLGVQHPSRTIVIEPVGGRGARIDAAIRSHAHELMAGVPVQYEEIRLRVWGTRARLRSLVEPLLVADVLTHLWWLGTPPWEADAFRDVLPGVNTLVVDSADFEKPQESFLHLASIADQLAEYQGVGDFAWVRLHPWREAIAQAFAPPTRRELLDGVHRVALQRIGDGQANLGSVAMTAGWLAQALGWGPGEVTTGEADLLRAMYFGRSGQAVEVTAGAGTAAADLPPGSLLGVRIAGEFDDQTWQIDVERNREDAGRAQLTLEIGGEEPLQQDVRLGEDDDATVLSDLLVMGRRDPVYLRSLRAGSQLLNAVR